MALPWEEDLDPVAPWEQDLDQIETSVSKAKAGGSFEGTELRAADNGIMARLYSGLREFSHGMGEILPEDRGVPITRGPGTPERIAEAQDYARVSGKGHAPLEGSLSRDAGKAFMENLMINAATAGVGMAVPPPAKGAAFAGTRRLLSDVGEAWMKRPGQQIVETAVGSGGQVVGEGAYGQDEGGGLAGYGIGAVGGGKLTTSVVKPFARLAGKVGENIVEQVGTTFGKAPKPKPEYNLLNSKADPLSPIPAARDRVKREIGIIENDMRKTVSAVEPKLSKRPGQIPSAVEVKEAERIFFEGLKANKARAAALENRLWEDSLSSRGISPSAFQSDVKALQRQLLSHDVQSAIPDGDIAEILDWKGFVSPRQIQAKISELGQKESAIWQDNTYRGNKLHFSANMEKLRDILLTALERSVKDPAKLAEAKAFTAARKEIYTKGPIWEALTTGNLGTLKINNPAAAKTGTVEIPFFKTGPGGTIRSFTGGADQLAQAELLGTYGGAKPLPLMQEFDNVVRAEFAAAARKPDGSIDQAAAERWMKENRANINSRGKLVNDLDQALGSLEVSMKQRKAVQDSAWAKFAGANFNQKDVSLVVRSMFSSPDKVKMARGLRTTMDQAKDPQVLEAYQNQVITQLFSRNQDDFVVVKKLLDTDPNVRRVIEETFRGQPEKLKLFDRILAAGERFHDAAKKGTLGAAAGKTAVFLGGLSGATLGRILNTGTIQVPAYMAKGFRGAVARAMGRLIKDPSVVVNLALADPKMAQWLLKKYAPNSDNGAIRQVLATARVMQTVLSQSAQYADQKLREEYGLTEDPQ